MNITPSSKMPDRKIGLALISLAIKQLNPRAKGYMKERRRICCEYGIMPVDLCRQEYDRIASAKENLGL